MKFIYVRGGDTTAPEIARLSGMKYGIRHDYKAYAPVHMLDIDFHSYEQLDYKQKCAFWDRYMARVDELKPVIAMTADYFDFVGSHWLLKKQLRDLQAAQIETIMVCPKFPDAVRDIPDYAVVAVSVPAPSYAGFLPDYRQLKNRRCHLLGGRPEKQAEIMQKILGAGGDVVSIDGSYHARKAGLGQWFDGGQWVQLRGNRVLSFDLAVASGRNIVNYLQRAYELAQPILI